MGLRWVGVVWAGAAAALVGIGVASATSSSAPPAAVLVLVLLVPVVATLIDRVVVRSRRRAHRVAAEHRMHKQPPGTAAPVTHEPPKASKRRTSSPTPAPKVIPPELRREDLAAVNDLTAALDRSQLEWLRATEFTTPWLDSRVRPIVALLPMATALHYQSLPPKVTRTVERLATAVSSFAETYARETKPDPLLFGEDWWFVEWDEQGAISGASNGGGEPWAGKAQHLRQLAQEVADAHDSFLNATRHRAPEPRRKRVRV